jgi:uncharacterized CHY-type Zn-finger protein
MDRIICPKCHEEAAFSLSFIPIYDNPFANCEIIVRCQSCKERISIKEYMENKIEETEKSSG